MKTVPVSNAVSDLFFNWAGTDANYGQSSFYSEAAVLERANAFLELLGQVTTELPTAGDLIEDYRSRL